LCDMADADGIVDSGRPGWRGVPRDRIVEQLAAFAQRYAGQGWSAEHIGNLSGLATEVADMLGGANLLRLEDETWWFAPAAGRWEQPPPPPRQNRTRPGEHDDRA
jgi:hypothetical protein